jgi:ABC-type multidrug transport system permease subunit
MQTTNARTAGNWLPYAMIVAASLALSGAVLAYFPGLVGLTGNIPLGTAVAYLLVMTVGISAFASFIRRCLSKASRQIDSIIADEVQDPIK